MKKTEQASFIAKQASFIAKLFDAELKPEATTLVPVKKPHRAPKTELSEVSYMAGRLVQCTLPHTDPGKVFLWQRASNSMILTIRPWGDVKTNTPSYPYGIIPRLLLYWLVTQAVHQKKDGNRRIELGRNLTEFMRSVGFESDSGGVRGDAERLKYQTRALFRASISTDVMALDGEARERWMEMNVAAQGDMWWEPEKPNEDAGWQGWIDLGERFFDNITRGPVPLSYDVLRTKEIRRSPLALDLYAYLTNRSFVALKFDKPMVIPWITLHEQLGSEYAEIYHFKAKCLAAINKIIAVYPALRVKSNRKELTIYPASPSVPALF